MFHRTGLGTLPVVQADNQKYPDVVIHVSGLFHNASGDCKFYQCDNQGNGFYRIYLFFVPCTQADPDVKLAIFFGINDIVFSLPYPGAPGFDNSDFIPDICAYIRRTAHK